MIEPKTEVFGILKPLTKKSFAMWTEAQKLKGKEFACEFCQTSFKEGGSYAITYSNWEGFRGGNPLTCKSCLEIPYEKRLALWKILGRPRSLGEAMDIYNRDFS